MFTHNCGCQGPSKKKSELEKPRCLIFLKFAGLIVHIVDILVNTLNL